MLKLNNEESKRILFLQQAIGASARDVIETEDQFVFIISNGEMGRALGKNGRNVETIERLMKREVLFIEYSEDVKRFTENIFFPTKINDTEIKDKMVIIGIDSKNKKFIIGKGGKKIKLAKRLLDRHFGIKDIKINENTKSLI